MDQFDETEGIYDLDASMSDAEPVQDSEEIPDIFQDENNDSSVEEESNVTETYVDGTPDLGDDNYMDKFLSTYGFDSRNIQITNEDGTVDTIAFEDLPDEEKISLLQGLNQTPITDEEINTINFLRNNKVNLADYVEGQKQQAVQDYLSQNQSYDYTVDNLTDEDLFRFDISEQYPNLTEAEIEDELERAQINPDLFAKKMFSVRQNYKQLEDSRAQQAQIEQAQEEADKWDTMASSVVDYARNTPVLHNLELSDDDKNEVLSFLLDKDVNGQTGFFKLFSNPAALFNLAWYAVKGDQAFNTVNDYYQGVIEKTRRAAKQNGPVTRTVRRAKSNSS